MADFATIKDLKKHDKFEFNGIIYTVKRKWINDEKPLIALKEGHFWAEERFYYEGLEIKKL